MTREIHIHLDGLADLLNLGSGILRRFDMVLENQERTMSAITDFAAQVNANFATIQSGIASLDAQIQAFQNSPGSLSPSDQAALDGIVAASGALAAAASAPVVPPVTPPTA